MPLQTLKLRCPTLSQDRSYLKERYGLDVGKLGSDQINTLVGLSEGGATPVEDMRGFFGELLAERMAQVAGAQARPR